MKIYGVIILMCLMMVSCSGLDANTPAGIGSYPNYQMSTVSLNREVKIAGESNVIVVDWEHKQSKPEITLVTPEGIKIGSSSPSIHTCEGKALYHSDNMEEMLSVGVWLVRVTGTNIGHVRISAEKRPMNKT